MELGMVGLGRMGANMVERLMRGGRDARGVGGRPGRRLAAKPGGKAHEAPSGVDRADSVEAAWPLVNPILESLEAHKLRFPNYATGNLGTARSGQTIGAR
jgi:6-phosphogluconate dehydrogenase (decarboxylating)